MNPSCVRHESMTVTAWRSARFVTPTSFSVTSCLDRRKSSQKNLSSIGMLQPRLVGKGVDD